MKVHLWRDGALLCNPQEALTQSSSDPAKVTCPECIGRDTKPAEQLKTAGEWIKELAQEAETLRKNGVGIDTTYAAGLKAARNKVMDAEPKEECGCVLCRPKGLTDAQINAEYNRTLGQSTALKWDLDDNAEPFIAIEAGDEDDKPCDRCGGSGEDPEYYEIHEGERFPVRCEACAARDWDFENLYNS